MLCKGELKIEWEQDASHLYCQDLRITSSLLNCFDGLASLFSHLSDGFREGLVLSLEFGACLSERGTEECPNL